MSGTVVGRRAPALLGLVLTTALALWWLGSSRLALDRGSDAARVADQALAAIELVRALTLALLALPLGAALGAGPGTRALLGLLAPAWPLLALVWAAGTVPAHEVAVREGLLLLAAAALAAAGQGSRRWLPSPTPARQLAGVLLAAALWAGRGLWLPH